MRVGEYNNSIPFSKLTIEVVGRCVEYEGRERERLGALAWGSFSESQEMKEEKVMM